LSFALLVYFVVIMGKALRHGRKRKTSKNKRAQIGDKDICKPGECRKILPCFPFHRLGSHNRYRQMAAMGTDGKKSSMPGAFHL
jgi:hypothetical protein